MKQKLFAFGSALLLCVGLCVPALAAPEGNAGLLPVMPSFSLSSGAGAWSADLTIHTDGTFEGSYHDSDMGDTGYGYDNGTVYISSFSGQFDQFAQVDPYTWSMKVASLNIEDTPGREWIEDEIRYIASEAMGMPDVGGEMLLYLPGHDRASLPEEFLGWTMFSGSGDTDAAQIDFFGLYNVQDGSGFGSSLEESQIAQAMQERLDTGEPQRLMELAAYYGDVNACQMSSNQARAFARVIKDQTEQLYRRQEEYGSWYGYITSYAALFDLGNGVPALFFAGGATSWDEEREDGCFWGDVGSFGIWLYEDGNAVEYEPPHSGLTLALFPSALFVGGNQGSDGSTYDGRVYPIRDGAIASDPDLIAQAFYEEGTFFLNGSQASEAEFNAVVERWGDSLSLTGHSFGGGVEGYIWGMCHADKMLIVLDAYAGAVDAADMAPSAQQPEDTAQQPNGSDSSVSDPSAPEKDEEPKPGPSVLPVVAIVAVVVAVLAWKKKAADEAQARHSPEGDGAPDADRPPVQPVASGPAQTYQSAQPLGPRREISFCPQCGNKVQAGDRFCTKCGNPLN